MVFPAVMYGCESWPIKKAEHRRIDAFELWCWRRLLRVPWMVQFSPSVVSDSLWPHEPQHPRLPCPSPTPGVYPNSCPSSRWCHPAISSSVVPFSSCPQCFPASGSFPLNQLFASASATVLPMNIQGWFPVGLSGLVSLLRLFTRLNNFRLVMLTL